MIPSSKRVCDAYTVRRRMLHPKWSSTNDRWKSCWRKVAELVDSCGYDLEMYMDAQFEMKSPFPQPSQLYSAEAIKRYEAYSKSRVPPGDVAVRRLEMELGFLESRSGLGFSLEEIFSLVASPLSPLFKYTVALLYGRQDIADNYREEAEGYASYRPESVELYNALLEGRTGDDQ